MLKPGGMLAPGGILKFVGVLVVNLLVPQVDGELKDPLYGMLTFQPLLRLPLPLIAETECGLSKYRVICIYLHRNRRYVLSR